MATKLSTFLATPDTGTAASHYYVETAGDGFIRPKTLANVKAEIVTTAVLGTGTANSSYLLLGDRTWSNVLGANTLTIGTGTYFVSNGSVGITTSSPYGTLTVSQASQPVGSSPSSKPNIEIWQGSATVNSTGRIDLRGSSSGLGYGWRMTALDSTGVHLVFANRNSSTTYTEQIRISSNGNVGIGTSSPIYTLEVAGVTKTIAATGTGNPAFYAISSDAAGIPFLILQNGSYSWQNRNNGTTGDLSWAVTGSERLRITLGGNLVIGNGDTAASPISNTLRTTNGSGTDIAGASLTIQGGRGTGTGAGGSIIFNTALAGTTGSSLNAATERMRIDSAGNVGIGGSVPASNPKLSMYGGIRFLANETAAATYTGIGSIASDTVSISTSGTERLNIGTGGLITQINATSGAGAIVGEQTFLLTGTPAAIGPAIADFFGATSSISLEASSTYEIVAYAAFLKTTANTVTWTMTASSAPTRMQGWFIGSPQTGIGSGGLGTVISGVTGSQAATTAAFAATAASLTTAVNHNVQMTMLVQTNAATNWRLQITSGTGAAGGGTVTPLVGSYYKVKKISTTTGTFV